MCFRLRSGFALLAALIALAPNAAVA